MAPPTDPLFAQQWHLPMIGNIRRIWDEYTGAGVTVAVYDTYPAKSIYRSADWWERFVTLAATRETIPLAVDEAAMSLSLAAVLA